jgi:hypothetical protein
MMIQPINVPGSQQEKNPFSKKRMSSSSEEYQKVWQLPNEFKETAAYAEVLKPHPKRVDGLRNEILWKAFYTAKTKEFKK